MTSVFPVNDFLNCSEFLNSNRLRTGWGGGGKGGRGEGGRKKTVVSLLKTLPTYITGRGGAWTQR